MRTYIRSLHVRKQVNENPENPRLRSVPNLAVKPFLELVIGSSIGIGFTLENKQPK